MTLVREYQPTFVLGDGETKEFSYLFEEVSENFIKVIVKHSDDSTYVPVFSVDLDSHKVILGESETAPLDTDIICIYRETPDLQDTPFRTLQGYDAKALENILSKIVAMIQELKANGFSTQILQGTPWQLDLLHPADDGASVVVDYNARILKKGLYFQIVSGNLQVSADGNSFITMPKSADITEFRRLETVLEDLTVQYRLQYKVDGVWYNAESNAEATADEALQIAQDAKDIAQEAKDIADTFDDRLTQAEEDSSDAKEIAEDAAETVGAFDTRITQAEQNASDAKSIAQTTSGNLTTHTSDTNNPHQVTKAQVGLGNVDNTSDLNKPISTATQTALNGKQATISDLATIRSNAQAGKAASDTIATYGNIVTHNVSEFATAAQGAKADTAVQPSDLGNGTITITQGGITKGTFTTNQGSNATIALDAGGGGGAVDSVNGKTGVVVLTATDVGALPDNTVIPTVNNPTITITQGGVTKGSFTLNQATGDTIDLDAGGGSGSGYHPDLFDVKWADHICNDVQWLRADTFSWQSGAVYQVAYQHLADDIDGKTLQSETVAGTTIQFYLADDGHKICPASEESNVMSIYNATGVAWYYIIDTTNQRFKLPRAKHNKYANSLGVVGNGVSTTFIKNINGAISEGTLSSGTNIGGYSSNTLNANGVTGSTSPHPVVITQDPTKSGMIAQQEQDTDQYKYLYFYVGAFTQTAIENTAGLNTELFNGKADLNLSNIASNIDYVVESQEPTAGNNYTWYRKYKSGWVEQGGLTTDNESTTHNLAIPMADTNYVLVVMNKVVGNYYSRILSMTTTGFIADPSVGSGTKSGMWQVSGIAA